MSLSYRNQSIDLQSKSIDWFLCERDIGREKVNKIRYVMNFFLFFLAFTIDKTLLQKPWRCLK